MDKYKYCLRCGVKFFKKPNCRGTNWTVRKYCSQLCQRLTAIASSNNYRVITPEGRAALSANGKKNIKIARAAQVGYKNPKWKGDNASYAAKHIWVKNNFGSPQYCDNCETSEKRMYHWANISGNYKRERSDWLRLCVPCHKRMDLDKIKEQQ